MIFSAPRFVVVDDKEAHLRAILDAFQALGAPGVGIHYKPDCDLDTSHFRGVRALFLDLHLIDGVTKSDNRSQYGQIAAILEQHISPVGGPFILVMWTEHSHLAQELTEYLDASLDKAKPHARPLAVLCLAKETFISAETGVAKAPAKLKKAITDAITSNPQLAALLAWEGDVLVAAGDTLAELVRLVPADKRTSAAFPDALDVILSRLARETVGRPNVSFDHRAAITSALAPILADRILNQGALSGAAAKLWQRAVTHYKDEDPPSVQEAGSVNRMLHLAMTPAETIRATDWGAVVELPSEIWDSDKRLNSLFDGSRAQLLDDEFKVKSADHSKCRPCLVRVGAACDYAQERRGPLTYFLGIEVPASVKQSQPPKSVWKSPVIALYGSQEPFHMSVNVRFAVNKSPAA
jgi:hypothetical protein